MWRSITLFIATSPGVPDGPLAHHLHPGPRRMRTMGWALSLVLGKNSLGRSQRAKLGPRGVSHWSQLPSGNVRIDPVPTGVLLRACHLLQDSDFNSGRSLSLAPARLLLLWDGVLGEQQPWVAAVGRLAAPGLAVWRGLCGRSLTPLSFTLKNTHRE